MATNYRAFDAAKIIQAGPKANAADYQDIAKRFPFFAAMANSLNQAGMDLLEMLPESITARRINKAYKEALGLVDSKAEAENGSDEAEAPKKAKKERKPKKAKKAKAVEAEPDEADLVEEELEEEEAPKKPKKAKKAKKAKDPEPVEEDDEDEDDDDFDFE